MAEKARCKNSDAETDYEEHGRAPCGARRKPARRNEQSQGAAKPSAFFFAVEHVFDARAAFCEKRGVRLVAMLREKREDFLLAR
jgi:hypothetical protein